MVRLEICLNNIPYMILKLIRVMIQTPCGRGLRRPQTSFMQGHTSPNYLHTRLTIYRKSHQHYDFTLNIIYFVKNKQITFHIHNKIVYFYGKKTKTKLQINFMPYT